MNPVQLIVSLLALVLAFVFVVIFPGSGIEATIIPIIASIAGALGVKNWRDKYAQFKTWYQSKTKLGAIVFSLPVLVLGVVLLFDIQMAEWLRNVLIGIATAGGIPLILGIVDAVKTNKK